MAALTGGDAVAALFEDPNAPDRGLLMLVNADGSVSVERNVTMREASRAIDLAVERAVDNIEAGERPCNPRRIRGGSWAVRLRCPDGRTRLFVERSANRRTNARPTIDARTRWDVLERDGFRCRYCGASAADTELHVDHVQSVIDGGSSDPSNLVAACRPCNLGKGRRSLTQIA